MKQKTLLEKNFQARVNKAIKKLRNTWSYHPSDRAKKGIPDLIICVKGEFVAIELKRSSKEKATPLQKHTLDEIWHAGGRVYEANPENWEKIFDELIDLAGGLK